MGRVIDEFSSLFSKDGGETGAEDVDFVGDRDDLRWILRGNSLSRYDWKGARTTSVHDGQSFDLTGFGRDLIAVRRLHSWP